MFIPCHADDCLDCLSSASISCIDPLLDFFVDHSFCFPLNLFLLSTLLCFQIALDLVCFLLSFSLFCRFPPIVKSLFISGIFSDFFLTTRLSTISLILCLILQLIVRLHIHRLNNNFRTYLINTNNKFRRSQLNYALALISPTLSVLCHKNKLL